MPNPETMPALLPDTIALRRQTIAAGPAGKEFIKPIKRHLRTRLKYMRKPFGSEFKLQLAVSERIVTATRIPAVLNGY
jgi:hypothetical protein